MTWSVTPLGEVIDILSGFAFESEHFNSEEGMPLIRIRDVVRGTTETRYSGAFDQTYIVHDGDLLIGMDGQFNVSNWAGGDALLNQRVCRVKASSRLDQRYLRHFLPQALKKIEDNTPFVTVKHLSVRDIREIEIPLPPLEEQRRIASILDTADALRQKRRLALQKLDSLTQSIFLDMFGDELNGENPNLVNLETVCTRITDGTHQPPKWAPNGIPFLFVSNVRNRRIDFSTEKHISEETYRELTRNCPIEPGDVLYTTVGSYGNSAVVPNDRPFAFQRHIAHLKTDRSLVAPEFLAVLMESDFVRRQADRLARGIAQKTLNLAEIRTFKVVIPNLHRQTDFLTKARKIAFQKEQMLASERAFDAAFVSLQHRAFQGEL